MNQHKYLSFVVGGIVATLIISNISAVKMVQVGPFAFDGGTFLFPLAYIFGDILTEVYGYKVSRKVIWTAFVWLFISSVALTLVVLAPASPDDFAQSHLQMVVNTTPRIIAASLIAYVIGEFLNSFVLAKMKVLTNGRYLWSRTIGSTLVAQVADTGIFTLVAFYGVFEPDVLWYIIISGTVFKIAIEVLMTPFTYAVVKYLKASEGIDVYDNHTNFNPFNWKDDL